MEGRGEPAGGRRRQKGNGQQGLRGERDGGALKRERATEESPPRGSEGNKTCAAQKRGTD